MTELNTGKMPLVSVVLPTYNRVHTLPRSIDSVLTQTYENMELIIIGGGERHGGLGRDATGTLKTGGINL